MSDDKQVVREEILKAVDNQLHDRNLPEAKSTYDRLLGIGYSDEDARICISQVLTMEIYECMMDMRPFNRTIYVERLNKLPETPWKTKD